MPMSVNFNCQCDDPNPSRTLAELRAVMFARLGMPDPITNAERRTLADMRRDLFARLGIPDPITGVERRALADMRRDLLAQLGIADPITSAERRTLGELRGDLLARLNIPDPIAGVERRTLAALRGDLMAQLGIPDPLTSAETRTLAELRSDVISRLGMPDPIADAERRSLSALRGEMLAQLGMFDMTTSTAQRTLGDLRSDVMAQLGMADPITAAERRTLASMRRDLMARLGMPDPIESAERRTLTALRNDLMLRLGFAAQTASPPPGMPELLNQFIAEAEQVLWRRLELDRGGQTPPPRLSADTAQTTLDAPMVFALALASAKAHYGQQDAELYLKKADQMVVDYAKRSPPGIRHMLDNIIAEAEQVLWRRLELDRGGQSLPPRLAQDSDQTTLDAPMVFALALASAKGHFEQKDAELYLKKAEQMLADYAKRSPPGLRRTVDSYIVEAEQALWRRFELDKNNQSPPARMASDTATTTLDASLVFAVAIASAKAHYAQPDAKLYLDKSEQMLADFARRSPPGLRRAVDSFIAEAEQVIWRRLELDKGGQPLPARMTQDNDLTTLDAPLVLATALASAKAHYSQSDAELHIKRSEQMLSDYAKRSPPGLRKRVDGIIAESEQELWRRLELDKGGEARPARMTADASTTTLDAPLVFAMSLAAAKAHYGHDDAEMYAKKAEQMLSDFAKRSPPGVRKTVDSFIAEAEQVLWRRLELDNGGQSLPARMASDAAQTTLDAPLVFAAALASAKAHFEHKDADVYFKKSEQMLEDYLKRNPPGIRKKLDSIIAESEQVLWRRLELDRGGQQLPARLTQDSDESTLDAPMVFALALASAKASLGHSDADVYFKEAEKMLADFAKRSPPGIRRIADSFVAEAEQTLWRRLELDKGGEALPARMSADGDLTTLDAPLVFASALASAKAHYGHGDAEIYTRKAEQALTDYAKRSPPGVRKHIDSFLNEAEQVLWRRLELDRGGETPPDRMVQDTDRSTLDAPLVFALALASAKAHFGQADAELYFKKSEQMLHDYAKRSPPGVRKQVDSFLAEAQKFLYRAYPVLRTERFFTWQMQAGERFYDVDANNDSCPRKLDPRMVSWVGVSEGADNWRSLTCGIPPESYQRSGQQGAPYRYEIRQCIEVWPAPDSRPWALRVKGDFGLAPLVDDDDRCTIDDEAVLLHALSRAKAHFKQYDAESYERDALAYVKNLTAGAHQTRRYVPGTRSAVPDGWPGWMREVH